MVYAPPGSAWFHPNTTLPDRRPGAKTPITTVTREGTPKR